AAFNTDLECLEPLFSLRSSAPASCRTPSSAIRERLSRLGLTLTTRKECQQRLSDTEKAALTGGVASRARTLPSAAKAVGVRRLNRSGKPLRHPKSRARKVAPQAVSSGPETDPLAGGESFGLPKTSFERVLNYRFRERKPRILL